MAERAQKHLETLKTTEERREFIKKKSHIWRAFGRYLSKMSYGKCWYSESHDSHSFYDVDHFRPKLEATRSEQDIDKPGYEWLAFSWDNFRYSANCSNRKSTNHDTGIVEGKGSWFPLMPNSVKACWNDRCESKEKPVLLDPVNKRDVKLIDVDDKGMVIPSKIAKGSNLLRVKKTIECYGLNLPRIVEARLRVMRQITNHIKRVEKTLEAADIEGAPLLVIDSLPLEDEYDALEEYTKPEQPYARAARRAMRVNGYGDLCAQPESQELIKSTHL
ncbi:MAG: hypothetical protein RLP12_10525 [Ekhidna sp.]